MARSLLFLGAFAGVGFAIAGGCAAGKETSNDGGAAPATSTTGDGFATSSDDASSNASGIGGACAGKLFKAEPIPLDIFVMLDQSGSMNLDAGNTMSRWNTVKTALAAFVNQPTSEGIGVGMQFFGLPDPSVHGCPQQACGVDGDCMDGCTMCLPQGVCGTTFNPDIDSCDASDYAWADVAIAPLPGNANAVVGSMSAHSPGTNTPTHPALQGAVDYAKKWETDNPTHVTVVAFATDGEPAECDIDQDHIDAVAATAFAGTPSIKTFVIGVGPALTILDGIAEAGGTTSAFHVDLDADATDSFLEAMNTIRGAALPCTYEIPEPPPDMQEDFGLVNVEYKPGDMSAPQFFPKVADLAACPASGDGWYYDDDANPTHILLCPGSCDKLKKDLTAELDIQLGCQTTVP